MMRFTIRDLLWLMVVVTLAVAWWVDRSRLAERLRPWAEWEEMINEGQRERWADVLKQK